MATWTTPKTDWEKGDQFNYTDYNRIKNNLTYINDMLNEMYPDKAILIDLGDDLTYNAGYTPSQFNAFEETVESFKRCGQDYVIGDSKHFNGNDAFVDYAELNRLEKICLKYKTASSQITNIEFVQYPVDVYVETGTKTLTFYVQPSNADIEGISFNTNGDDLITLGSAYKVHDSTNGECKLQFDVVGDSITRYGSPVFEDIQVTIMANAGNVGAATTLNVVPNGTFYTDSFGKSPISLLKAGDDKDGENITTMFCIAEQDVDNIFASTYNTVRDNGSAWRRLFLNLMKQFFSTYLRSARQTVTKVDVKTCNSSGSTTESLSTTFELVAMSEFGITPPSGAVGLGDVVYDITSLPTETLTRDKAYNSSLQTVDCYCIPQGRNSYMKTGSVGENWIAPIRPMIFITSSQKVKRWNNTGFYYFDWWNDSETTLADIPSGTRVYDIGKRRR